MLPYKKVYGVTLLELVVVVTILMTVLGLVGGAMIDSLGRARAQTEVISVYSLIKKSGVRAFSSGMTVLLKFDDSHVEVFVGQRFRSRNNFAHLEFDEQVVRFNRNGMVDSLDIDVRVRGEPRSLNLRQMFHDTPSFKDDSEGNFAR